MGTVNAGRFTTDGLQAGSVFDFSGSTGGTVTPLNDDGTPGAPIDIATTKIVGPYNKPRQFRITALGVAALQYVIVDKLDARVMGKISDVLTAGSQTAAGDGVTDDTNVIEAFGKMEVLPLGGGKTYRITRNITINEIKNDGGYLYIEENVTVTGFVNGPDDIAFIKGPGIFKPTNNRFSVGWFEAATYDLMWDMCRKGMGENVLKDCEWPELRPDALAYNSPGYASVYDPIQWDRYENNVRHNIKTGFFSTKLGGKCVIEISKTVKSEDVELLRGLNIDCGSNCDYGVYSHGGSRFFMKHKNRIMRPRKSGYFFEGQLSPLIEDTSEPEIGFLECTKFGVAAIEFGGLSGQAIIGVTVDRVFSNGARCIWGTAHATAGVLTSVDINLNGPNGQPQDLTGHGWAGEVLHIFGRPGVNNGYGATATVTVDGFGRATSVTVVDGGTGVGTAAFTEGNLVAMTSAESYVKVRGATRNCGIGRVLEVQDDKANLCPPAKSIIDIKSTDQGSSQKFRIGMSETTTGRRPLLDVGDLSSGTASKNMIVLDDIASTSQMYDGGAYVRLSWCDYGSVKASCELAPGSSEPILKIDHTVSNMDFYGIPLNRVTGGLNATNAQMFGSRNTFNGAYAARVKLDKDQVFQLPLPPSMNGRAFIQNQQDNGGYADINIRATSVINQLSKGASLGLTTGVLTGTTGTDTQTNVSLSGNILYIENRTATAGTIRDFTVRVNID